MVAWSEIRAPVGGGRSKTDLVMGATCLMDDRKYHIILNEVGRTVGAGTVDGSALCDFMFNSNEVTAEVADKSEDLLTELMNDGREWFWVELESPSKMIGASGFFDQAPLDRVVLGLKKVHKMWRNHGHTTVHPLQPILEAWVAVGGKENKADQEAAWQGPQD